MLDFPLGRVRALRVFAVGLLKGSDWRSEEIVCQRPCFFSPSSNLFEANLPKPRLLLVSIHLDESSRRSGFQSDRENEKSSSRSPRGKLSLRRRLCVSLVGSWSVCECEINSPNAKELSKCSCKNQVLAVGEVEKVGGGRVFRRLCRNFVFGEPR